MSNVMLDLETLGNGPESVIIAIGAVKFSKEGITDDLFYTVVDPESCVQVGLKMDTSTVMWWMQQSDAARAAFKRPGEPLSKVLEDFAAWCPDVPVWGNGASFDNVILSSAYRATGIKRPWSYWNDRCYRTLKSMSKVKFERTGTHHNALDDALYQAEHLRRILGWVK